jgi:hypothetical protein
MCLSSKKGDIIMSIEDIYNHTKPCKMQMEFPTYSELDKDLKDCIDSLKRSGIIGYYSLKTDTTPTKIQFGFDGSTSIEVGFDGDVGTVYGTRFFVISEDISQNEDYRNSILSEYGEEYWEKLVESGNLKLTTKDVYVIVEKYDYESDIDDGKGLTINRQKSKNLISYFNYNDNNNTALKKGKEQTRDGEEELYPGFHVVNVSYIFIPVTLKFYVDGELNTDDSLVPNTEGNERIFVDLMQTNKPKDLPEKVHIESFRDISQDYIFISYEASVIRELMKIDSNCVKDIYIENANYGSNFEEPIFIRLPKESYVINSNGFIRDSEDPNNEFSFSKLEQNYGIEVISYFFDENVYVGRVLARLDSESLGIETVSGEMKLGISGKFSLINIHPIVFGYDSSVSTETVNNCSCYLFNGSNGFMPYTSSYIERPINMVFRAMIGTNVYSLDTSESNKCILGFKLDGHPKSSYIEDFNSNQIKCGVWDDESHSVILFNQEVTAYVINNSVFQSLMEDIIIH